MGAAEDKIVGKRVKPSVKPVVSKVPKPINEAQFNETVLNKKAKTKREADAQALADKVTKSWTVPKNPFSGFGNTSSAPAGPTAAQTTRANTVADRALVNPILNQYGTQAQSGLDTRYANYLNTLNQGNAAATGQINTATQNLLASLPTTYQQATTPTWMQPTASSNAYQQYLQSMGMNTTDIGNLQQQANATAQANTNMYQGVNTAQNAVQQNYLNALRAGAGSQGAAALQTLATNTAGQKAAAQQAYGTSQQNILQTLLPLLIANPTGSSADVLKNVVTPDATPKNLTIGTPKTSNTKTNPLANAPKSPKPNQKYNVGSNHYVWKADKKTWVKSKK